MDNVRISSTMFMKELQLLLLSQNVIIEILGSRPDWLTHNQKYPGMLFIYEISNFPTCVHVCDKYILN